MACPCCGYETLSDSAYGSFEMCEVCSWEDDPVQLADPWYEGGANGASLIDWQRRYADSVAQDRKLGLQGKAETIGATRDAAWRPVDTSRDRPNGGPMPYWLNN